MGKAVISPALAQASTDRRIRGAPREVLLYLNKVLDPGEYRPLKLWPVAEAVGINKSTAGRAIVTLLRYGYIREGKREEHGKRTFLLLTSCGEAAKRSA